MSDPLSTARTALTAASTIADVQASNMATSKTIAGKGQSFILLSDSGSRETASGNGGVSGTLTKRIDEVGAAENDGNPLHVCLGKRAFFITDYGFTRVGTWKFDREGDCINHIGHKMKCFQLNEDGERINPVTNQPLNGNFNIDQLVTPNVNDLFMNATATNSGRINYNLAHEGSVQGTQFGTDITVYDSMGGTNNLRLQFTRAEVNGSNITTNRDDNASVGVLTNDITGQNAAATAMGTRIAQIHGNSAIVSPAVGGVVTVTVPATPATEEIVYTVNVVNDATLEATIRKVVGAAAAVNTEVNNITNDTNGAIQAISYATAAALDITAYAGGEINVMGTNNAPQTNYNFNATGAGPYNVACNRSTTVQKTAGTATAWYLKVVPLGTDNLPVINPPYTNDGVLIEFDNNGRTLRYNNNIPAQNGSDEPPALHIQWPVADDNHIQFNLNGLTNNGAQTRVGFIDMNGNTSGQYRSMEWDEEGYGVVTFSNNVQRKRFQIAQARFPAEDQLRYDGDGNYLQTSRSGQVIYGFSGDGFFEDIRVAAIERSNVSEIQTHVDMISNQRYYMAQISVFKTAREMAQALDNL